MKKLALLLTVLTLAFPAQAVEIGDIYYSNKSFSSTPVDGLLPIGIVWQVNDAGNGGLIVALEQPGSKNWERAKTYCRLYLTRGTKAGDWFMPDFLQMFPIDKMQNRRINARTFLHINDRLALVKEARALKEDVYMTSSDYADDKKAAIGINLTTGELVKHQKKGAARLSLHDVFLNRRFLYKNAVFLRNILDIKLMNGFHDYQQKEPASLCN